MTPTSPAVQAIYDQQDEARRQFEAFGPTGLPDSALRMARAAAYRARKQNVYRLVQQALQGR